MSGSAIVDGSGRLTLMYSGASESGVTQNIVTSDDGVVLHKSPANPAIPVPPPGSRADFRDPKMVQIDGTTFAVIGAYGDGKGRALVYRAGDDLLEWTYVGVAAETSVLETMWECPDLFPLGDRFALVISPISGVIVSPSVVEVGTFDVDTGKFVAEARQVLDVGDVYAPQAMVDSSGRRVLIGWMGHRDLSEPTVDEGWYGALTIPRELVLVDGRVQQRPVRELEALRGAAVHVGPASVGREGVSMDTGPAAEVRLVVGAGGARRFRVGVRVVADRSEQTCYVVDRDAGRVICDRSLSGRGPATGSVSEFEDPRGELELRFFLDTSSIELFVDDGAAVVTQCVYPDAASTGFSVEAVGADDVDIRELTVWPLDSI
jgi:beta-fructofuranosidase